MLNHFLKNSLGGHNIDFPWTLLHFFKFMDFSFFEFFSGKWTLSSKFGLLKAQKSKIKLQTSRQMVNTSFRVH